MAIETKDRLEKLLESTVLNGIDFVEIADATQQVLKVHFLNTVLLAGNVTAAAITGGETIPTVAVDPIQAADWSSDSAGRPLLTLRTKAPGDFSTYLLTLTGTLLDSFFDHSQFSFKAGCPSTLDCETPAAPCPPPSGDLPPIDYLAKDFLSFRKALLDFSALRYPEWKERSEADFGMMFLESLASLGDDLSYTQDRIHTEAALDTATQRRSVVRHARLVDYEPRPATSARVLLQFDVQASPIPPGLLVSAAGPDGQVIEFETGDGLTDPNAFTVNAKWNRPIAPYWFDDSRRCLKKGALEMWVLGQGFGFTPGQQLLIDTQAATTADEPIREVVTIADVREEFDPLFPGPPSGPTPVTHLFFSPDSLLSDHDLTRTVLAGNLVPATQGRRFSESFAIASAPPATPRMALAIARLQQNSTAQSPAWQYLYTLGKPPLAWLGQNDPSAPPLPEIVLTEEPPTGSPISWTWRSKLLDAARLESAFTVDPVRYAVIAKNSDGTIQYEYDGDEGATVRFGDGIFGQSPQEGSVFRVSYRSGGGAIGNVASDTITRFDPAVASIVTAVTNPFAAAGGLDQEPNETVQRLGPQAFRAKQFRAVRPEDYQEAATRLSWVQRAGTAFRWTGSWLTVFTTADPKGSEQIAFGELISLIDLLNRYRMAGYESYAPPPRYVGLDLKIQVCARPDAFRGDVQEAVLTALSSSKNADGTLGFFFIDNFTFGMPLEPSAIEAAIQNAYGVGGVISVRYRRRGYTNDFVEMTDAVKVAADEIIRVDNDPSRPERGSIEVKVEGGK